MALDIPAPCSLPTSSGDPGVGSLSDNGSPGNGYFPLLDTSPAIDSGNNDVCLNNPPLATDQIGNPRVGLCDIGAIERQDIPLDAPDITIRPTSLDAGVTRFGKSRLNELFP
jgi:hypothetical protein